MRTGSADNALVVVVFLIFAAGCLFLCVMAAPDKDELGEFYVGGRSLKTWQNGFAIAGDYINVLGVITLINIVATAGYDGALMATTMTSSLIVLMVVLAEPLRNASRYTMGDAVAGACPSDRSALLSAWSQWLCACPPLPCSWPWLAAR
ncbi:hypothetical protein [Streptomyces sp. NPDC048419]|uniref:sodium:solute symporter family transporter n=1 Tax=Streptomyces sp. NPDC048419 TaxID=3365547 RepID=UPI003717DCD8